MMMDVTVHHTSIGRAGVTIDLGGGHSLEISARHQTDRYRRVTAVWRYPGQLTGTVDEVFPRGTQRILNTELDLRERKEVSPG